MSGQITNGAPKGGGGTIYRREEGPRPPLDPESEVAQAAAPTLRDRLLAAWDKVMAPAPQVTPMPPAQLPVDVFNTPEGGKIWGDAFRQSQLASMGLGPGVQRSADSIGNDYGPGESLLIGAGAGFNDVWQGAKQLGLNARYLAAAVRGSPSMADLGAQVDALKRARAEDALQFNRLAVAQPSAGIGQAIGSGFFSPGGVPEDWLPRIR